MTTTFTSAPTLRETGISIEELRGCYSDMHKDAYGFRPRNWSEVKNWTHEDFEPVMRDLDLAVKARIEQDEKEHNEAAVEVEKTIANLIAAGAADRAAAIRWLHDAEKTNGDNNYLCFCLGLRYEYFANEPKPEVSMSDLIDIGSDMTD